MSKPIVIPNTFQNQVGPIPLIQLDQDFSALAATQNDFATYSNYLVDVSGAVNQITVSTPAGTTFSYVAGVGVQIKIANTTTSATVNINVNSLGNQPLVNSDGSSLVAGQFVAGQILYLIYDGTSFRSLAGLPVTNGSFTGTLTGMTTATTGTINYRIANGICTLTALATITGTSNANSMTMTGLPAICQTVAGAPVVFSSPMENNSVTGVVGLAILAAASGTITLTVNGGSGSWTAGSSWTASGGKGLIAGWTIIYPLN